MVGAGLYAFDHCSMRGRRGKGVRITGYSEGGMVSARYAITDEKRLDNHCSGMGVLK